MAITGISSIDNKQIIAAGALSATSANQALVTSGGDSLQGLYDTVSTNSGSWTGGGGVISSYTSAWSNKVPPYGDYVINSLNGKNLSAFVSNSADRAIFASIADSANSAGYAQTVDVTYVENQGFVRNLSSEYGTISVVHNNLVESTNSAVLRTGKEGFVSSFGMENIGPYGTASFSWNKSLPNTIFTFTTNYPPPNTTVTYSANTNLTGEILPPGNTETTFNIDVPNVTSLNIWSNNWISIINNAASAADTFETTVGELAWASALPTYEYDSSNKISAINGSALAGGSEFPQSATEAIETVTANSGDWNSTTNTVSSNSGVWGGSALPISAGPGINVNIVDNTLVFSNDETVLWSGTKNTTAGAETLSESYMNFDKIDIYLTFDTASNPQRAQSITRYYVGNHTTAQPLYVYATANNIAGNTLTAETLYISGSPEGTGFSLLAGIRQVNSTVTTGITSYNCNLKRIVGINRIAGGN